MEKIIVEDIVPILVIMALGYICGKTSFFDDDQRQGLNKVVLNIALPAALFVSIVKASREMLAADLTLTLISIFGIVAMFMLAFFLSRLIFHRTIQEAAVCALISGAPTIGFLGFAILDPIYGASPSTDLVIGIVSIVVNAITIPIGYYLINLGQSREAKAVDASEAKPTMAQVSKAKGSEAQAARAAVAQAARAPEAQAARAAVASTAAEPTNSKGEVVLAHASNKGKRKPPRTSGSSSLDAVLNAVKQPIVWAPLLAVLFVLVGVKVPDEIDPCFELIAKANAGLAVLVAGLSLSTVRFSFSVEVWFNTLFRLILTPAVFLGVALLCGMGGDVDKVSMLVLAVALPPAFSGIIIASRYNIYVREGASTTAVATVCFVATCILWVWLVPVVAHAV